MTHTSPDGTPIPVRLADYKPPSFLVPDVALDFDIRSPSKVFLIATSQFRRNPKAPAGEPVELLGEGLELTRIAIDGRALVEGTDYTISDNKLHIPNAPDSFTLEVITTLDPQANESATGLYRDKDGTLLTQCESSGFRHMTWFPDRPDVMSKYAVTITGDSTLFPALLSNGNTDHDEMIDNQRRRVHYVDPFPKPSYLFALVAADLDHISDTYRTMSGRTIDLEIYVPKGKADQAHIAMASLQRAMKWDEDTFGLECDVDRFVVVSTDTFNMGAMENKGLNVFNSQVCLARADLATDASIMSVEKVIGHEYFHNWTGNRVTCRDWFQLTLKEGLTVYRDQEFSSDMNSRLIERIGQVRILRTHQFPKDAGPSAHPIRPESYAAIDNLYTTTIYNKGAEIIRMLATLVGVPGFRRGMDLYFQRHDGQAVTCEDFLAAIVDANTDHPFNVERFKLWYSQAGTPDIAASSIYDATAKTWTLKLTQTLGSTPGQTVKQPMLIPITLGLLDAQGRDMAIGPNGETQIVLHLTEAAQEFTFQNVAEKPVPSLLRNFSAPVRLAYDYSDEELAFLMAHDSDGFNRWDAAQRMGTKAVLAGLLAKAQGGDVTATPEWRDMKQALAKVLVDETLDPAAKGNMLILPGIMALAQDVKELDYQVLHAVRLALICDFAQTQKETLLSMYHAFDGDAGTLDISNRAMADRVLKNVVLGYLSRLNDPEIEDLIYAQAARSPSSMTDVIEALRCIAEYEGPKRDRAFSDFLEKWNGENGPVNSWFSLQVATPRPDALDTAKRLLRHPLYDNKNPNNMRAVIGGFSFNMVQFHAPDGEGYKFVADQIIDIDSYNPMMAARLVESLVPPSNLIATQKALMIQQLERIAAIATISTNTSEIVHKALNAC